MYPRRCRRRDVCPPCPCVWGGGGGAGHKEEGAKRVHQKTGPCFLNQEDNPRNDHKNIFLFGRNSERKKNRCRNPSTTPHEHLMLPLYVFLSNTFSPLPTVAPSPKKHFHDFFIRALSPNDTRAELNHHCCAALRPCRLLQSNSGKERRTVMPPQTVSSDLLPLHGACLWHRSIAPVHFLGELFAHDLHGRVWVPLVALSV